MIKEVVYDYNLDPDFKLSIPIDFSSGLYFWEALSYENGKERDRESGRLAVVR